MTDHTRTTSTRTVRTTSVRGLRVGLLLTAAAACSASPGPGGGDDAGVASDVAWCAQFDVAMQASAGSDGMDRDDPAVDDALAEVQAEMGELARLDPPTAVAADWDVLSGSPTTDAGGGLELGGERAEAGRRIAAWALDVCDLSAAGRAAIDDEQQG